MTTSTSVLPSNKAVRDMLNELLGRDVTVGASEPVATGPKHPIAVGVYVDDSDRMAAVAVGDLACAAYAGAAIGLVPAGGAQAAVEDGELSRSVADNFAEVLNIMAALFNVPDAPHLRLYRAYAPGEALPTDVATAVRTLGRRLDLAVSVAGYGAGTLSLVLEG